MPSHKSHTSQTFFNYYAFLFASILMLLMLSSFSSASASDSTSTQVNATVNVGSACTLDVTEDVAHTAKGTPGTTTSDIGLTTLKTVCNDGSGYAIYTVGFSSLEFGNTKMLATIGGELSSANDIVTGTATSGNTSNWAMKLNAVAGTYAPIIVGSTLDTEKQSGTPDFSGYTAVPSTYTRIAYRNSATDIITGSSIQSTYRTYIATTQPAGTYEGKVKYTLVHPASEVPPSPQTPTVGCINYFANASNAVGTMGCQSKNDSKQNITDGSTVTLLASNFSRAGYGFAGWSDSFDYATNPNAHFYGPQESFTVPTGTVANGLALYAVWIKSQGSLQDTNKVATLCGTGTGSLTTAPTDGTANLTSVSALTDQRDGETYAIAKLADGKCWMIENLRLENTAAHNTDGLLAQGYNASFAGLADPEAPSLFANVTTANSLYSTNDSTDKTISGSNQGYRFPRYNNVNTPTAANNRPSNPTANTSFNSTSNAGMYSYGNYYTWAAAIADTTNYTTNNQSITKTSICPTGWHLPKGGNNQNTANNDFLAVSEAIIGSKPANYDSQTYSYYVGTPEGTDASNALRAYPNNFVYSALVYNGFVRYLGYGGYYWSSTAFSGDTTYLMTLDSSIVNPGTGLGAQYYGRTIRCLASDA